jgi:hypothetical protein
MRLRPYRRNLVVWSQSAGSAGRYSAPRPARARRIRSWVRIGALLTAVGLMHLGRALQSRWQLLLPGVVFTVAGVMLRRGTAGVILLPGLMLVLSAPLIPATSKADRRRRAELERELAGYSTQAQRRDLEAILDQYPDDVTSELRDILASHPVPAHDNRFPAMGRY